MRRLLITLLAVLAPGLCALGAATAQETVPPDRLVRQTTEQVLSALRENQEAIATNPSKVYDLVSEYVLPRFDFELMSRFVLAQAWRSASETQQQRFVEEFRRLLVRTYGKSLAEYSGQEVKYLPMQEDSAQEKRVTVQTEIVQQNGPEIPLAYKLYRTDQGWKVYDVIIDGVSLVLNYRSSFNAQIARDGLDSLIQDLAERNRKGMTG